MPNISHVFQRVKDERGRSLNVFICRALRDPRPEDFERIEAEMETCDDAPIRIAVLCFDPDCRSRTLPLSGGVEAEIVGPGDARFRTVVETPPMREYYKFYLAELDAMRRGMSVKDAAMYIIRHCKEYRQLYHYVEGGKKKRNPGGSKHKLLALMSELESIQEVLLEQDTQP